LIQERRQVFDERVREATSSEKRQREWSRSDES
jgi:hypothetical protein